MQKIESKGAKLLENLKRMDQFEEELLKIQADMKERDDKVKARYKEDYGFEVDKVIKKQGFYIKVINKREEVFPEQNVRPYLEATRQLDKNKNTCLTQQRKHYQQQLKQTQEALNQISKEYGKFAEDKRKQINELTSTAKALQSKHDIMENKYKILAQEKVTMAADSNTEAKLSGIGVVPFICEKLDKLFQEKLPDMNLGEKELSTFIKLKNDIIGKFEYSVVLLKRKQLEKDKMDEEADLEMRFHLKELQLYKKDAIQAKKMERDAADRVDASKSVLQNQVDFIFREKKRFDDFPRQIAEFKRKQRKHEDDKKRLKKIIADLERRVKKSLGKKVEAMVAAKSIKDAKEKQAQLIALREQNDKERAYLNEIRAQMGLEPLPPLPRIHIEPATPQPPPQAPVPEAVPAQPIEPMQIVEKVEKDNVSQKSSKRNKEMKREERVEQIIEEKIEEKVESDKISQASSKKKKEVKREGGEENDAVSQTSSKRKKEVKREEAIEGDTESQASSKRKKKDIKVQKRREEVSSESMEDDVKSLKSEASTMSKNEGSSSQKSSTKREEKKRLE